MRMDGGAGMQLHAEDCVRWAATCVCGGVGLAVAPGGLMAWKAMGLGWANERWPMRPGADAMPDEACMLLFAAR